jgi:hypothetical protein
MRLGKAQNTSGKRYFRDKGAPLVLSRHTLRKIRINAV